MMQKTSQAPCFFENYSINSLCPQFLPRSSLLWAGSTFWVLNAMSFPCHFHHTMAERCALWIWFFRVWIHIKSPGSPPSHRCLDISSTDPWVCFWCKTARIFLKVSAWDTGLIHSSVIQALRLCLKQLKKERSGFLEGFACGRSFMEQSNSDCVLSTGHCQGWPKMWFQWRYVLRYFYNVFIM